MAHARAAQLRNRGARAADMERSVSSAREGLASQLVRASPGFCRTTAADVSVDRRFIPTRAAPEPAPAAVHPGDAAAWSALQVTRPSPCRRAPRTPACAGGGSLRLRAPRNTPRPPLRRGFSRGEPAIRAAQRTPQPPCAALSPPPLVRAALPRRCGARRRRPTAPPRARASCPTRQTLCCRFSSSARSLPPSGAAPGSSSTSCCPRSRCAPRA